MEGRKKDEELEHDWRKMRRLRGAEGGGEKRKEEKRREKTGKEKAIDRETKSKMQGEETVP